MYDVSNVFSSVPFLESVAAARFPGKSWTVETAQVESHVFRLLVVRNRPVVSVPWLDFHEPVAAVHASIPSRALKYLRHAAIDTVSSAEWYAPSHQRPARSQPSPFIEWRSAPATVAFPTKNTKRRWRQLELQFGNVVYTYQDPDPRAFEQCIVWKRAQYRSHNFADALADPATIRLLHELRQRGLLIVSTLRSGGTLAAAHIGMEWDGRLYWWIPSYAPALAAFSPGRMLLHALMHDSHARGHREFDFLLGDEEYKWLYATHTRIVSPLGSAPLSVRSRRVVRTVVKRGLQVSPALWNVAQRLRRLIRSL